jgi:hypothetical protein
MKNIKYITLVLALIFSTCAFGNNEMPFCEGIDKSFFARIWVPRKEACFGTKDDNKQRYIGEFYPDDRRRMLYYKFDDDKFALSEDKVGRVLSYYDPNRPSNESNVGIDFFASVFDGIERRKKWLLNLKQGKSNLPICEGPIKKWDNCFEMTRTDCGDHIGEWRGGEKYGKGSTKGSFGESFDGKYLNDWDANGVVDYPNGSKFSGDLKITCKFDPNGQGIYRWRNGDTVSGSWVDGYLEGFATVQYVKDPKFKHDTFANQYVRGVPIFNTKSCLQKREGEIIENLGIPEKAYEADGKKYLSYKIYDDYNFQKKTDYQHTCTASFDTVFTVVSGKVVSARDSTLKFGSKFDACTGKFDFSNIYPERYGCYK